LGYTPKRRAELGDRLGWYLDPEAPEKPNIDWSDPEARVAHLKEIVQDARDALSLTEDATATPAAAEATSLLEKIVADDVLKKDRPQKAPSEKVARPKSGRKMFRCP
jgi:hypothetical protein